PLLAGDSLSAVRLEPGRMDVALDVRRGEDGGLALRPDLPLEEGAGVILIGTPAHGLGVLREGALTLHQLTGVLPDLLRRLLLAGELEAPAEDADRFLTLYYPSLARQAPMRSADLILPTPEDVEPALTLDVRVGEGHAIQLEWGFRYPVPTVDGTSR